MTAGRRGRKKKGELCSRLRAAWTGRAPVGFSDGPSAALRVCGPAVVLASYSTVVLCFPLRRACAQCRTVALSYLSRCCAVVCWTSATRLLPSKRRLDFPACLPAHAVLRGAGRVGSGWVRGRALCTMHRRRCLPVTVAVGQPPCLRHTFHSYCSCTVLSLFLLEGVWG